MNERALGRILQVPVERRHDMIAEGLELIAETSAGCEKTSSTSPTTSVRGRPRS